MGGVKVLTWTRCRPDGHVNSDNELDGKNTIQGGRNPSFLPCDGVGSGTAKLSKLVPTDDEKLNL